jgi:hypothetical protein
MKIELGKKQEDALMASPVNETDKDEMWYPTFYVDGTDAEVKIGEEVTCKGRVVAITKHEHADREGRYSFDVEIHELETKGSSKKDNKEKSDDEEIEDGLSKTEKEDKE